MQRALTKLVNTKSVGLLVCLAVVTGCGLNIGEENTWDVSSHADTGVTVEATGIVKVVPDGVQFNFSVFALGSTSKAASQSANVLADQARKALDVFNIDKKDITTQNVSIYPEYSYAQDGKQTLIGFRATQSFAVTLRNAAKAGDVVDEVVSMVKTGLTISMLSATLLDTEDALDQARAKATALAKKKAENYADLLNVELGSVLSIREYGASTQIPQPWARGEAGASDAALTIVDLGTQEVSLTLQVRWALKD